MNIDNRLLTVILLILVVLLIFGNSGIGTMSYSGGMMGYGFNLIGFIFNIIIIALVIFGVYWLIKNINISVKK